MEGDKKFKEKTLELIDTLNDQMKQLEESLASKRKLEEMSETDTVQPVLNGTSIN